MAAPAAHSPESEDIQACVSSKACMGVNRARALIDYQSGVLARNGSATQSLTQLIASKALDRATYQGLLCAEGCVLSQGVSSWLMRLVEDRGGRVGSAGLCTRATTVPNWQVYGAAVCAVPSRLRPREIGRVRALPANRQKHRCARVPRCRLG